MELKPCPVCGKRPGMEYSDDYDIYLDRTRYFRFVCCGIRGEPYPGTFGAAENWNRRVGEGEKV